MGIGYERWNALSQRVGISRSTSVACLKSLFLQPARQSWRRKEFREFAPTFLGIVAASFFDVTAHHVFPEIIIDHVASVSFDEFHPLPGASWLHHRVFLQP